ncbi:pyruvate-ferredoxin/flavodoxin oxidoreductase [Oscillibacter sp. PC13]|uniref:pyruvate:ferredoxin (flavodoxin) oxidoreductase n=1 Tax=Oscillibacter sp. PC13 TaxID=1855299 RepID=UPI0008F1B616|nr:pyruvate:ferredoxin (flavodoxin) oxidoreductase [Oscillibacter sp. PC13]SFP43631.1 pyruvate-ferredoxin/flavodoxin oxidoreductase [Oscillibacter sp. PC13]
MKKQLKTATMDGNTAAAYASYAFTEVATIYPITPSSVMAEMVDVWSANGRKNIFGQTVEVREMQHEGGAAGAIHGALQGGALASTYTASQGLMLMLPNMYKIAGELLPGVFHVSARALASNALSIYGDHQDVMTCRNTGFTLLAGSTVQQAHHLACVAHLAAIQSRVPVLHFFDGFRTSHEYQKIQLIDYEDLRELVDWEALKAFRDNALNPDHPKSRGSAENPDVFFQTRESVNKYYEAVPGIVEAYMDKINAIAGTNYKLFNYYGAEDAEDVIIAMGSACGVVRETMDFWNARGKKLGLVEVHLYRPFSAEKLLEAVPVTAKRIAVLDRTKEPGSLGEPLYLDVKNVFADSDRHPLIVGGRYGLGSKDFTPMDVMAVYANLHADAPKNGFTVSIVDDVTHHSLPVYPENFDSTPEGNFSCKFWGLGSDGTVGANKSAVKIIGDHTDYNVQAYFAYDAKKSGGVTISHLRFGPKEIKGSYQIKAANFIACHNQAYVDKYDLIGDLKEGGTFLLNTIWKGEELEKNLPASLKRRIAEKKADFYTLDAVDIAKKIGLGGRINMVMQAGFFALSKILPLDDAVQYLKEQVEKTYGAKGQDVVDMNNAAIDQGIARLQKIDVPEAWATAEDAPAADKQEVPKFFKDVLFKMGRQEGNDLPVSAFNGHEDGSWEPGYTQYEKRGIAIDVPAWDAAKCVQCNRCSVMCSHAVIRPTLLNTEEAAGAPADYAMKKANGQAELQYHLAISGMDCTGCGVCVKACPAKALTMEAFAPRKEAMDEAWEYTLKHVTAKTVTPAQKATVKGSQFLKPYLEFSGACAGCGETPYIKLITQLYGDHMRIANSAGCTHIWGGSPEIPFCTNEKGQGVAWASGLFEDTAEYGFGMLVGSNAVRKWLKTQVETLVVAAPEGELKAAAQDWAAHFEEGEGTRQRADRLIAALEQAGVSEEPMKSIYERKDYLPKTSQWIVGGDGWAYDIGYSGLDHVVASGENVNIICVDTEVYSNTGGQSSKATPTAAVAQFAAAGKKTKKKDLGMMCMSYGYVYVAQVAMGYDPQQTLTAIREAEAYDGPSIIIAYAPCINHGIKGGMSNTQNRAKAAVEAGYWHCYRYNPTLRAEGKNPFSLDSKEPTADFREFLMGEVRYSSLLRKFPETAEALFAKAEQDAKERTESYLKLARG